MARAKNVLVLRPGGIGGYIYHRRRGERRYRLLVEGHPSRPGKARKRTEVLLWLAGRLGEISALSSREKRISASVIDLRTASFPLLIPHRVTATILVTYTDAGAADRVERSIREALGRRGPRWEMELVSDRPPMPDRKRNKALADDIVLAARRWEIPLATESSVWPSVAGLAPPTTATACGIGPVARDLYTPQEAVQRISLMERTLLLAQLLARDDPGN
jgi:D-alanine-D-alanine ligase